MLEHGKFELEITEKILTLRAYGAWNFETATRWVKETKKLASSIKDEPWSCICDLTEWELATPDIHNSVLELNLWLEDNNMKYLAIVYATSIQRSVLQKSHQIFNNVEVMYFTSLDEGKVWLESVSRASNARLSKAKTCT